MTAIAATKTGAVKTHFGSLSRGAQVYIALVVFLGSIVITESAHELYTTSVTSQWFILAALTLLSGSITVRLPSIPATISVSETFVFTSVLLFGTAAGTITVTLDGLIISLWLQRRNFEVHKLLFNTTAPALSIWIAAQLFFAISGTAPLSVRAVGIATLLPGLLAFALAYFLLNSWLMAAAVSFEQPISALQVWRQNFMWLSLNFFSGASVAILLVSINREVNVTALAVIVPLLVISYLTYHTSMGRLRDANRHVEDLNHLYLSTIETLAMAIDAKDQVTHGHIRRVQSFSIRLAQEIGISDEKVIKAIEAASLLHDMGKLAIPERILNKPGKLSDAEFEIMKVHAAVGADILSAIKFPYPVIPIVRHHHENWDGSGYPDGLAATDIPIGARVLAVVDCFDALTSDRPYRPKLPDQEAIDILRSRSGKMYDPLIVEGFIRMKRHLPIENENSEASTALAARMSINQRAFRLEQRQLASASVSKEWSSKRDLALPYSIEVLANYITRTTPDSVLVLYTVEDQSSALRVMRAWGQRAPLLNSHQVPLGKGVSGWVAATKQPVYDAISALDFQNGNSDNVKRYSRCASEPVVRNGHVIGVLTLYASSPLRFIRNEERQLALASAHFSTYLAYGNGS